MENEAFVELAAQVRDMTRYAQDHRLTIAVMGCRVNGPGETDDADLGLWCGPHYVNLKHRGEPLGALPYDQILNRLKQELDQLIREAVSSSRPATRSQVPCDNSAELRPVVRHDEHGLR